MDETPFQMDTRGAFSMPENHKFDAGYGLTEETIDYICDAKGEPDWLRQFRKNALKKFNEMPMPYHWAPEGIRNVDFENFRYYLSHGATPSRSWDEVPEDMKRTFERLGVPEQERAFLAGVDAQHARQRPSPAGRSFPQHWGYFSPAGPWPAKYTPQEPASVWPVPQYPAQLRHSRFRIRRRRVKRHLAEQPCGATLVRQHAVAAAQQTIPAPPWPLPLHPWQPHRRAAPTCPPRAGRAQCASLQPAPSAPGVAGWSIRSISYIREKRAWGVSHVYNESLSAAWADARPAPAPGLRCVLHHTSH